jgi:hypothetical protein
MRSSITSGYGVCNNSNRSFCAWTNSSIAANSLRSPRVEDSTSSNLDHFQALAGTVFDKSLPLGSDRMAFFLLLRRNAREDDRLHSAEPVLSGL